MNKLIRNHTQSVVLLALLIFCSVFGNYTFSVPGSDSGEYKAIRTDYVGYLDNKEGIGSSGQNNYNSDSDMDETQYIYWSNLTTAQQNVYKKVLESSFQYKEEVDVEEIINESDLSHIMTSIFNDHPELFWIDTKYLYNYTKDGQVVKIKLYYNMPAANLNQSKNDFNVAAEQVIKHAQFYDSDLEKEKYVYQELQQMIYYKENAELNQSAYSALVNLATVCAGYSRAFQYIMQQLGITCYFCTGSVDSGMHAWNIININGEYYNVDLSWDDMLAENKTEPSFEYFNKTDRDFLIDHQRSELSEQLPECNTKQLGALFSQEKMINYIR